MEEKKNETLSMRIACLVVFVFFTFSYLYYFQPDVLAVYQHVLSGGATSYNRTIGTIIITLVLVLLQLLVYAITRLHKRTHALTYLPPMLLLAFLTDVDSHIETGYHFDAWLWVFPVVMVIYIAVVWMFHQLQPYEMPFRSHGFFSRNTWINLAQLLVMIIIVTLLGNSNAVFHYRMRMESLMMEGKYEEALDVGRRSLETDSSLTYLRIRALEETHQLGSRLFTYPIIGGSKAMYADGVTVKALMWQDRKGKLASRKAKRNGRHLRISEEERLMALLLDKKLDAFVADILRSYPNDTLHSSLPLYFRQALMLYTHTRSNPRLVYHNSALEADFEDFQSLVYKNPNKTIRQNMVRDTYANTYWYYYLYE